MTITNRAGDAVICNKCNGAFHQIFEAAFLFANLALKKMRNKGVIKTILPYSSFDKTDTTIRSCFEFLQKVFLGLMYPFSCVLWAIFWSFSLLTGAKMPQKLIPNHRTINSKQLLIYLAKLTARVSRITVIFTCPG